MHLETGFCFEALIHSGEAKPWQSRAEDELYSCISRAKHSRILSALGCLQPPKKTWGQGHRQCRHAFVVRGWCLVPFIHSCMYGYDTPGTALGTVDPSAGQLRQDQLKAILSCRQGSEDIQEEEAFRWVEPSSHGNSAWPSQWGLYISATSRKGGLPSGSKPKYAYKQSHLHCNRLLIGQLTANYHLGHPFHKSILGSTVTYQASLPDP